MTLLTKQYDPEIFKKAMGKLLKSKDYHVASPTKTNEMLKREYKRILNTLKRQKKK